MTLLFLRLGQTAFAEILGVFQKRWMFLWGKRYIQNRVNPYGNPPNDPPLFAFGADVPNSGRGNPAPTRVCALWGRCTERGRADRESAPTGDVRYTMGVPNTAPRLPS